MIAGIQRRVSRARLAASPMPMRWPVRGATMSASALKPPATAAMSARLAIASTNSASRLPLEARSKTGDATLKLPPHPACRDAVYRNETIFHNRDKHESRCRELAGATCRCRAACDTGDRCVDKARPVGPCSLAENGDLEGKLMSFAEYTDAIKAFVTLHREWAAPIVFVLAFGESLAFVSLILPFWGMLVVIGTIIGASDSLSFWVIMSAAAVGAALGDWLSYWLGYPLPRADPAHVAAQPLSQPDPAGAQVLHALGCLGHRDRPLLRAPCAPACRSSPASRRCPRCASSSPTGARPSCGRSCCCRPGTFRPEVVARPFDLNGDQRATTFVSSGLGLAAGVAP